jgi:hypothetical protein
VNDLRLEGKPCGSGVKIWHYTDIYLRKLRVCMDRTFRQGMETETDAYTSFCLMTMFECTLRSEPTTAAQVSSADDSTARTVKDLAKGGCRQRAHRRRVSICFESRAGIIPGV